MSDLFDDLPGPAAAPPSPSRAPVHERDAVIDPVPGGAAAPSASAASATSAASAVSATSPATSSPASPAAVDRTALLQAVDEAVQAGALRRLDGAFARFIAQADPQASPALLLAAALLAQGEGRGHSCLLLEDAATGPDAVLGPRAQATRLAALHGGAAWPDSLAGWHAALAGAASVAVATSRVSVTAATEVTGTTIPSGGSPRADAAPLVLQDDRLYLRRYWRDERRVAAQVRARAATRVAVDEAAVRAVLDRLFPAPDAATAEGDAAIDWQKAACAIAMRRGLSVITGGPGTGKTYTAARLLALLQATAPAGAPLRLALAAPTGKAAARLRQSIESALQGLEAAWRTASEPVDASDTPAHGLGPALQALAAHLPAARTLHALLGTRPDSRRFRHDARRPLDVDVLVVDEASMVHLEMMAALLDALPAGARLVLLGDKDQLASVEAGAVLGDLCADAADGRYDDDTARYLAATTGQALPAAMRDADGPPLAQATVMLRRSQRFGSAIGGLAAAVNAGDAEAASRLLGAAADARADAARDGGTSEGMSEGMSERTSAVAYGGMNGGTEEGGQAAAGAPAIRRIVRADPAPVVALATQARAGSGGSYRDYLARIAAGPADGMSREAWIGEVLRAFDRCRVLCAVREGPWGVSGLNRAIEAALADAGALRPRGEWYEGRPVIVTRNDAALGVFNGDVGIVLRAPATLPTVAPSSVTGTTPPAPAGLRAYFADGAALRSVSVGRLADVETAFALTVHKSQGSEFAHTILALPPEATAPATRELLYTGITRAREALTIVAPEADAVVHAIARTTRRASGLRQALAAAPDDPRPPG